MITVDELTQREPRLRLFYSQVRPGSIDALPGYKSDLCQLVGWYSSSTDSVLITPEAYDAAYHHLIDLLGA